MARRESAAVDIAALQDVIARMSLPRFSAGSERLARQRGGRTLIEGVVASGGSKRFADGKPPAKSEISR